MGYRIIVSMLLLISAFHPFLATGQFGATEMEWSPNAVTDMSAPDCSRAGSSVASGETETYGLCVNMKTVDCVIAANQGICGNLVSAIASDGTVVRLRLHEESYHATLQGKYVSVVLETLTPPPNSSEA